VGKAFLRDMSKPYAVKLQEGVSVWTMDDLKKHQKERQEDEIRMLQEEAVQQFGERRLRVVEDDFEIDDDDEDALMQLDV